MAKNLKKLRFDKQKPIEEKLQIVVETEIL